MSVPAFHSPFYHLLMGCGATEATGLGFVCFVVINPHVLTANRVDFGLFLFHKFFNFTPPPLPQVSYLEIYMEVVKDLINPSDEPLRVRQSPAMGVYVENLAEIVVRSEVEIMNLLDQGKREGGGGGCSKY